MEELKPCPFCGSEAKLTGECDMVWARCSNDNCRAELITRFDEPEDAIREWNQRAYRFSQYYNKGNDCDTCQNQYLCGTYGDAVGCKRKDDGLDCEFVESEP